MGWGDLRDGPKMMGSLMWGPYFFQTPRVMKVMWGFAGFSQAVLWRLQLDLAPQTSDYWWGGLSRRTSIRPYQGSVAPPSLCVRPSLVM